MISKKSFLKPLDPSIDKDHKIEIKLCKKRIKANKGLSAEEKEKYIKYWIKTILKIPSSGNY